MQDADKEAIQQNLQTYGLDMSDETEPVFSAIASGT
jgi:hypothetical protein